MAIGNSQNWLPPSFAPMHIFGTVYCIVGLNTQLLLEPVSNSILYTVAHEYCHRVYICLRVHMRVVHLGIIFNETNILFRIRRTKEKHAQLKRNAGKNLKSIENGKKWIRPLLYH